MFFWWISQIYRKFSCLIGGWEFLAALCLSIGISWAFFKKMVLSSRYRVRNTDLFGTSMAIAYCHGEVLWLPAATLEVPCNMSLSNWPYDTHECVFIFGNFFFLFFFVWIFFSAVVPLFLHFLLSAQLFIQTILQDTHPETIQPFKSTRTRPLFHWIVLHLARLVTLRVIHRTCNVFKNFLKILKLFLFFLKFH